MTHKSKNKFNPDISKVAAFPVDFMCVSVCLKLRIILFHSFQAFRAVPFRAVFPWAVKPSSLVLIWQQYVPRNAANRLSEYTVS